MKKKLLATLMGLGASSVFAQVPMTQATVILGAGKVGSWDTSIEVTNVDPAAALPILITAQYNRSEECAVVPCNDYASTTIPPLGTFTLSSIPPPKDPSFSNAPQAFYVLSPVGQNPPSVSAFASDAASACGRGETLPVVRFAEAFDIFDLVFAGAGRDATRYVNLLIAVKPDFGTPLEVNVTARDASGNLLGQKLYQVAPEKLLLLVDVLGQLGVSSLESGSIRLSEALPDFLVIVPFTAVAMIVEPDRIRAVTATRVGF